MSPGGKQDEEGERVEQHPAHSGGDARPGNGLAPAAQDVQKQQEKGPEIEACSDLQEQNVKGNQMCVFLVVGERGRSLAPCFQVLSVQDHS